MAFKNYKDESRGNWGTSDNNVTLEQLNTGAILRIADATEKMASNYTRMEADLKWYKERQEQNNATIARLVRSNNALRGHIKRIKKQTP